MKNNFEQCPNFLTVPSPRFPKPNSTEKNKNERQTKKNICFHLKSIRFPFFPISICWRDILFNLFFCCKLPKGKFWCIKRTSTNKKTKKYNNVFFLLLPFSLSNYDSPTASFEKFMRNQHQQVRGGLEPLHSWESTYASPNTRNPTKCFNFVGKNQIKTFFLSLA